MDHYCLKILFQINGGLSSLPNHMKSRCGAEHLGIAWRFLNLGRHEILGSSGLYEDLDRMIFSLSLSNLVSALSPPQLK